MRKRTVFLVVFFVAAICNLFSADYSGLCGDNLYWQYYPNDSILEIKGYGNMKQYNDYFDVPWHSFLRATKVIKLPQGLTSISSYAFEGGWDVREINIPNSVVSIGERAFAFCVTIFNLEIPSNVQTIGKEAFDNVPFISYHGKAYGAPWAAKCINGYLQEDLVYRDLSKTILVKCNPLHKGSVIIPDQTQVIEEGTFGGCEQVTDIFIPYSVTDINERAFYECGTLTNINVDTNNPAYCSVDGVLFNKDLTILKTYPSNKTGATYNIPTSVEVLGVYAFSGNKHIREIDIPQGVRFIHEACFGKSESLEKVTCQFGLMAIRDHAFMSCSSLLSIELPESLCEIDENAFMNCFNLIKINIPSKIKTIKPYTFSCCKKLKTIYTGDNVTKIEEYAFSECTGLENIRVSNNLSVIEDGAFHWCDNLKNITWGTGLRKIEKYAFDGKLRFCTIICKTSTPPDVDENAFNNWRKYTITIIVPRYAVSEYNSIKPWSNFEIKAAD